MGGGRGVKGGEKGGPEGGAPPPPTVYGPSNTLRAGGGGLAQGLGIGLSAFGGAYWPLATAHGGGGGG